MSFNWKQPVRSFVQQVAQKVEQMEPQPEYIDAAVREYLTEEGASVGYNVTDGNLAVNLTGVNTPSADIHSIGGNPIVPESVAANSVTDAMLAQTGGVLSRVGEIAVLRFDKNLVDPSSLTTGGLQSDGTISTDGAWANYVTSDFISLEPNTDYAFTAYNSSYIATADRKIALLYNESKQPTNSTYINSVVSGSITFNSGSYAYARVCSLDERYYQLEKGVTYSEYKPYTEPFMELVCSLGATPTAQVEGIIGEILNKGTKTVAKSGNHITVLTSLNGKMLLRNYYLSAGGNSVFWFDNVTYDGTLIKASWDDITPQRVKITLNGSNVSATIGANHGWNHAYRVPKQDLDDADIGSTWTDGITQYTLLAVNDTYAFFVPQVSKADGIISITNVEPTAALQHVSGATHTNDVSVANMSAEQLYPSINNHSCKLYINGSEVTDDGTYRAEEVRFVEQYGIMDLYELVTYAQANVGSVDYDEVKPIVTLSYVVDVTEHGEVVYTNLTAEEYVYVSNSGFMQASELMANSGTVYRYVNGVASGTFDSTGIVDMTSYNTNVIIYNSDKRTGQIPNRCVDVCKDSQGNILYGFAFGFLPDIGDGADSKRSGNSYYWDMRSTKKAYPSCVENKELNDGDQLNVIGYRAFLPPTEGVTDKFSVKLGGTTYFFVDTHEPVSSSFESDAFGEKVDEVSNDGMNLGDCIGSTGISYWSNESYSAAVVSTKESCE